MHQKQFGSQTFPSASRGAYGTPKTSHLDLRVGPQRGGVVMGRYGKKGKGGELCPSRNRLYT